MLFRPCSEMITGPSSVDESVLVLAAETTSTSPTSSSLGEWVNGIVLLCSALTGSSLPFLALLALMTV